MGVAERMPLGWHHTSSQKRIGAGINGESLQDVVVMIMFVVVCGVHELIHQPFEIIHGAMLAFKVMLAAIQQTDIAQMANTFGIA